MRKNLKKLIIVDGQALIHRSFHALPPTLRAPDGRLTNAVYGFTSFLLKALNEFQPDFAIMTFDLPGPTQRHQIFADYKATRVKAPDELYQQIPIVREVAISLGLPILEAATYEADDLIGTVSAQAEKDNLETIIITGDLDTLQLINDRVKVYTMSRGLSDSVIYDEKKVKERYRLLPSQIIDFKALRGDPSDNIPGVKGIGEKGAADLLIQYNNLENIIQAAKAKDLKMKPRLAALIRDQEQSARLSQQLATINHQVPVNFSWSEAIFPKFDSQAVFKLFSQLGFKSLLNKVQTLNQLMIKNKQITNNQPAMTDEQIIIKSEIKNKQAGMNKQTTADKQATINQLSPKNKQLAKNKKIIINKQTTMARRSEIAEEQIIKQSAETAKQVNYLIIKTDQQFTDFLKKIKKEASWAISAHYNQNNNLLGMAISWRANQAYYLPLISQKKSTPTLFDVDQNLNNQLKINNQYWQEINRLLVDPKIKKITYNLKNLIKAVLKLNCQSDGWELDIMVAAHLLQPDQKVKDLPSLAFCELGLDPKLILNELDFDLKNQKPLLTAQSTKTSSKKNNLISANIEASGKETDLITDDIPEAIAKQFCLLADFSWQLFQPLKKQLIAKNLWLLFETIEKPLIPILAMMELRGIALEKNILNKLSQKNTTTLKQLNQKIQNLAGKKFNPNSTKQLKEILYHNLAIPTFGIKKTKTGFSTAEEELNKLKNLHPIIPLLQEYRELFKLQTTYLDALPPMIKADGRVHTNFQQTITATGRLSSSEPNLQNIPIRTSTGRQIRQAFVAAKGWKLIAFDYSQIELRLAAHLSGDKNMIRAFKQGADIHSATAAAINQIKINQVTAQQRQEAKAINFGIIYGQGAHGLSQAAGINYARAKDFISRYFKIYPGIKKMMNNFIAQAKESGYAITICKRQRPLPDLQTSLPQIRKSAERMAINTPIQGSAADIIKLAMIKIDHLIADQSDDIRLLLQIHDELIFEIKETKINHYQTLIKKIMTEVLKLKVPIIVDSDIGDNWGELK